jgi:putative tryptophan/tyrosine transport system substrate-binding protein
MRRRAFIALLAGAAMGWPLAAHAQQPATPVIGFLTTRASGEDAHLLAAFRQGLKEAGYVEGRNVGIEFRFAENRYDRLPALAADLVHRRVAVIVTMGAPAAPAATIPIVFGIGDDPVRLGLVASLNRTGGNVTGQTGLLAEVGPKRLELLRELLPAAARIAVLINPAGPNAEPQTRDLQAAARTLGLQIDVLHAGSERDFEPAFAALRELRAGGLVIGNDPFFNSRSGQLAALALRHAVPTIYQFRQFAAAGGLMSYGANPVDGYRQVGLYTGRILAGEKPADLPVQQATKVELIINLATAKALGLTVPLALIGRADEVIE